MELRDARECGHEERIRKIVARREDDALQIHRARHENQPRQRDADVLQLFGKRCTTRCAVAFTGQIHRRAPAPMTTKPRAHAFSERIDIPVDAQHLLSRIFARGNRIAGMRRIDENEIEMLEP